MSSGTKIIIDLNLLECPFLPSCNLPKIQFLCKNLQCKNCPDYIIKLEKIK
ncbi:MAG: hypothetical protein KGD65_12225 [Candidatus Lokiarchaeota archaeon]|nr:hypothetical protein [Candidatus Lokiarchaeota archaeon]